MHLCTPKYMQSTFTLTYWRFAEEVANGTADVIQRFVRFQELKTNSRRRKTQNNQLTVSTADDRVNSSCTRMLRIDERLKALEKRSVIRSI